MNQDGFYDEGQFDEGKLFPIRPEIEGAVPAPLSFSGSVTDPGADTHTYGATASKFTEAVEKVERADGIQCDSSNNYNWVLEHGPGVYDAIWTDGTMSSMSEFPAEINVGDEPRVFSPDTMNLSIRYTNPTGDDLKTIDFEDIIPIRYDAPSLEGEGTAMESLTFRGFRVQFQ